MSDTPSTSETPAASPTSQAPQTYPALAPLSLAALAAVAVPGLDPARLALPQSVSSSLAVTGVVDTHGRHWEVLQALTDAAGAALEAEDELLRRLARAHDDAAISFDVARPAGALHRAGTHVQVRSHVEGRALRLSALRPGPGLSAGLGRALGELHDLSPALVSESGLPVYEAGEVRERWRILVADARETGRVPARLLTRWEAALQEDALWRFRPTVVHGDLAEENILTAGGSVLAVRGLSQVHVGDPAEDLAWVYATAPVDALDSFDAAYESSRSEGVDKHARDRAELVSELGLLRWLMHGIRAGDESIVSDAVSMLADLDDQLGAGARDEALAGAGGEDDDAGEYRTGTAEPAEGAEDTEGAGAGPARWEPERASVTQAVERTPEPAAEVEAPERAVEDEAAPADAALRSSTAPRSSTSPTAAGEASTVEVATVEIEPVERED